MKFTLLEPKLIPPFPSTTTLPVTVASPCTSTTTPEEFSALTAYTVPKNAALPLRCNVPYWITQNPGLFSELPMPPLKLSSQGLAAEPSTYVGLPFSASRLLGHVPAAK